MSQLTREECRVLGVLVEKAQTTPAQYPLTLNGLISGCNQKSNRLPVVTYNEDIVLEALDSLRGKGFVAEVMMSGSRVQKFRHKTRDVLEISTSELVVLAELLLRGPQTTGEIRGRASRMHPLESIEVVENILQSFMERQPPLIRRLPPAPGSRSATFAQLLCPDLHPVPAAGGAASAPAAGAAAPAAPAAPAAAGPSAPAAPAAPAAPDPALVERVDRLESEVTELRRHLQQVQAVLDVARSP